MDDLKLRYIIKKELICNINRARDYDLYELHQHSSWNMDDAEQSKFQIEENEIHEQYDSSAKYIDDTEIKELSSFSQKECLEGIEKFLTNNPNNTTFSCKCNEINIDNIKLFKFEDSKKKAHAICSKCLKYLRSIEFVKEI